MCYETNTAADVLKKVANALITHADSAVCCSIIIRNIREVPKFVFALPVVYTVANTVRVSPLQQDSGHALGRPNTLARVDRLGRRSTTFRRVQTMFWISYALDTDRSYQSDPENPGEKEQEEIFVLLLSALLQAFLYIMAAVYVVDNAEYVAKRLEAAAPRPPAAEGAPPPVPSGRMSTQIS